MTSPNVLVKCATAEKCYIAGHTEIAQYKKILHRFLLLFALWISLGFLGIEVGVVLTSTSILVILVVIILVLVVVTLVIQSLASEEEDGSGYDPFPDVVTNLKVDSEESLKWKWINTLS